MKNLKSSRSALPLALFLTLLGFVALACSRPSEAPEDSATQVRAPETPIPGKHVRWVRNSAEHRAIILQVYQLATQRLEELADGREPGTWVVIMDADETIIDNSLNEYEMQITGRSFTEELFSEWVRREEAVPLPGAVRFMTRVRELGGKIAVVTNRYDEVCPETEENFDKYSIPYDVMLCREGEESSKSGRWARVERGEIWPELGPLEIVMWIGDRMLDFPGFDQSHRLAPEEDFTLFGDRYFILPNPMYGTWEGFTPN